MADSLPLSPFPSPSLQAQQLASELEIPFATNRVDEMLLRKDVDMVVVCSPPPAHADMVIRAINAGKHVVCEKPPGLCVGARVCMCNCVLVYASSEPY